LIIHSIVADEVIYAGIEDVQAPVEMWVNGIFMQVEAISDYEVKIVRVLSPELAPYLNDNHLPGQIIQLTRN